MRGGGTCLNSAMMSVAANGENGPVNDRLNLPEKTKGVNHSLFIETVSD